MSGAAGPAVPTEAEAFLDEFLIIGLLGTGAYGQVFKATHTPTESTVAIKQLLVENIVDCELIANEIDTFRDCTNKHIVQYMGSFLVTPYLHIIMEFCEAGSVADIIRIRNVPMTEVECAAILQGSLRGLEHMHTRGHIHRDIKAGNVLLGRDCLAKLADFGVAGKVSEANEKRKTVIGTPFWMAPEIILETGHDTLADIWSLGILTIEMAEMKPPLSDVHPMRAIYQIAQNPPPVFKTDRSKEMIKFLSRCLVKNSPDRATATELIKDPFIATAKPARESLNDLIDDAIALFEKVEAPLAAGSGSGKGLTMLSALTMKPGDVTGGAGEDAVDDDTMSFGTMQVNDTMVLSDTMVPGAGADAPSAGGGVSSAVPAYMKHIAKEDAKEAKSKSPSRPGSGTGRTMEDLAQTFDVEDLRRRLQALSEGNTTGSP